MRLNCAPRRFFLTKENGVLLCIRELRGFSILLRPRQNHFKNFLFPSVLPLEETPNPISVFVVVVQPLGATPRAHTLGHGIQSRQQTPLTDMGSLYLANACSVALIYVPTPYSAHFTMPNLSHFIFRSYILPCKVYSHYAKVFMPERT